jgi:hypothetical protein
MLSRPPSHLRRRSVLKTAAQNPLAKAMNKLLASKKEKLQPMPFSNAFKLIETLLDKRINVDLENEISGKQSKHISNFILDQLSMKFGLKTLAIK